MDEVRKRAYRLLLYHAMLDIRPIAWMPLGWIRTLNPFKWHTTANDIRRAGEIADWLHNLASYSAHDFKDFNEEWFWRELDHFHQRHPEFKLDRYRKVFDQKCPTGS
jgi:hypothetical protein